MKTFAENELAEFWIENDTVHFKYKDGVYVDLSAAKKVVAERLKLQDNRPYPVFCDMTGLRGSDKDARDYLANEGSDLVEAVAVLVSNPVTKMMINFYLKINQPKTPTRSFTDREEAFKFLRSYVQKVA